MRRLHFGRDRRKGTFWRTLIIIFLIIVILASIFAAYYYSLKKRSGKITVSDTQTKTVEMLLDPGTAYSHAVTDTHTFFFSVDSVKIASNTGVLEQDMVLKASNPIISTDGKYALIADKGGKTAHLFFGSRLDKSFTLEENILIAKTNSNGYSLFITEGDVHKHSAIVITPTGEEVFKWKSGSMYVVSADISDNNRDIALSTISTDNGVVASNVYMFNITKDKPFANEMVIDELFGAMQFDGSYMYCIGSAATYIYNDYGKCISQIDYEDRELLNYVIKDGTVALLYSGSTEAANGSVVCSYTSKGALLGSYSVDSKATFLDLEDGNIAVDNNRVISILDSKCREKFRLNSETTISDFLYLGSSSVAVGITATGAEIIEVKK